MVPPVSPTRLNAWRSEVLAEAQDLKALIEHVEALGDLDCLHLRRIGPCSIKASRRLRRSPSRGCTRACYYLETVSGPRLGQELRAFQGTKYLVQRGQSVIDANREMALRDRLDMLLHQHGMVKNRKASEIRFLF